jgi:type I restriction enzyme, S subunit
MRFADFVQINPRGAIRRSENHPCVMMEDIVPGNRYVAAPKKKEFKGGSVFKNEDTLFARITPCLENGKIAQYRGEPAFGSTEFVVFREKEGISNPAYIFYLALSDIIRKPAEKSMFGASGRQRADLSVLSEIEINPPPLPTQRKIAAILSAYDDLIENNTRRIRILEEMAQAIYREWFVHFRFPGHEGVRLVETGTELGLVPEGWEVKTIRYTSAYINRGVSPKYDENSDSWVINQKCIRDNRLSIGPARRHSTKVPNEKMVRFGDVLINSTGVGTLGRVAQVYQDLPEYCVDSHVTIARPNNKVTVEYYGFYLLELQNYFDHMGTGATNQTELGRETISNTEFLVPSFELQEDFSNLSKPMLQNIINLQKRNENLRQQRDLLLPRLVSGEVGVEKIDLKINGQA